MVDKTKKWMKNDIKLKYIPFPAIKDCVGIFNGFSVEIFDKNDMRSLHLNSFYGTGSFSRSMPKCLREEGSSQMTARNRNWEAEEGQDELDKSNDSHRPKRKIPDSAVIDHKKQKLSERTVIFKESLDFMLEESFFLHHQIKCLKILDLKEQEIPTDQLWLNFCELKHNFVECFVAYMYLKSKNWVIKSGIKFGGDFVLYKNSPQAYHAAYIVLVRRSGEKVDPNIFKILYRIAETTGKEVLYLDIFYPERIDPKDFPACFKNLNQFQVLEMTQSRFNILNQ